MTMVITPNITFSGPIIGKAQKSVINLQKRIYKHGMRGNFKKAKQLQKLLYKSYSNTIVSIYKVTCVNNGKKTAGIDGVVARDDQSRNLILKEVLGITQKKRQYQPKPVRRLYIPKKDGTKRPLGIPVMKDRVMQAIVENTLYPYTESQVASYEAYSYGFRKGVSTFDAISSIIVRLFKAKSPRLILDGDFKKCFDNISHNYILEKAAVGLPKTHLKLVNRWLEAGHIEIDGQFYQLDKGTPQGGIISP